MDGRDTTTVKTNYCGLYVRPIYRRPGYDYTTVSTIVATTATKLCNYDYTREECMHENDFTVKKTRTWTSVE